MLVAERGHRGPSTPMIPIAAPCPGSRAFGRRLRAAGIRGSMGIGSAYDNAMRRGLLLDIGDLGAID
jgi:hypothetical protein